jgi:predicted metallo-beta-lactamase superfamily hydrolase
MTIEIIGTESLGVRGLCCLVKIRERRIFIDPGVALGYMRNGLLPHLCQVAVGQRVRQDIINALETATDIVFSHFHGDHIPLLHANPFQLSFQQLPTHFQNLRCWSKSDKDLPPKIQLRASELAKLLGPNMKVAEGYSDGPLSFSEAVPHGLLNSRLGTVMMTRIDMGDSVFVHASDIQLLDDATVEKILKWQPDIVFASGPPFYLRSLNATLREKAWENALHLARNVDTLILDHHLLRCEEGAVWLDNLRETSGGKVCCGADFMGKPRLLLEARRPYLYQKMPVPENWHQDYFQGKVGIEKYVGVHLPFCMG